MVIDKDESLINNQEEGTFFEIKNELLAYQAKFIEGKYDLVTMVLLLNKMMM